MTYKTIYNLIIQKVYNIECSLRKGNISYVIENEKESIFAKHIEDHNIND